MSSYRKIHLYQRLIKPIQKIPIENYKINEYKKESFKIKMCICIHCYNIDIFNELMYYVRNFFEFDWQRLKIIIHYVHQDINKIKKIIEILCNVNFENDNIFTFIKGDNIGADIGGFIRCCEYISDDDDIVSIIHTKTNKIWRRKMMNIFTKEGIYTSMSLFQSKTHIGSIGTTEKIQIFPNIHNYSILIRSICNICNYNFNINKLLQSNYLAGTIFMCRKNLLDIFIKNRIKYYKLLQNFDLLYSEGKKRPLSGDYEHATELIFGYLCIMNNKKLVGIY